MNLFKFCTLLAIATVALAFSGCLSTAQLEGKLPHISADSAHIHVNTIYGESGKLDVRNLRYETVNGQTVKKADQYDFSIDSPAGSVTVQATNVTIEAPPQKK